MGRLTSVQHGIEGLFRALGWLGRGGACGLLVGLQDVYTDAPTVLAHRS